MGVVVQLLGLAVIVHGLPAAVHKGDAAPTAMQTDCMAISINVNDYWCQTMCPTGQCPEDMCKCGAEAAALKAPPAPGTSAGESASFAARDVADELGDVPMVIVGEDDACKSLSDSASDEWCTSTCKDNTAGCPTMCDCSGDNKEVVTEDPLEAAQKEAEKAAKDAANGIVPPVAGAAPAGVPDSCYTDANKGSNQCGPISKATCTGKGEGEAKGKCCSVGGYCGSGPEYCGDDMQKDYSHGHNVCAEVAPPPAVDTASNPAACYSDANLGSNQCGPAIGATCTGNGLGEATGKCCSATGYCGNGPEYCTDDMQKDYSHGHNVCAAAGTAAAGTAAAGAAADGAAVKPAECLKDGNLVSSMCGPALQMTCTGSHGLGKCCSATGWCGNDPEFCGEGMQEEYSNAKNLCKDELPEGVDSIDDVESMCMTMDQVAVAWVSAVAKLDKADAQRMCVPAVIVAAGSTYNTALCADKFDPTVEAPGYMTTLKGLWQIADEVYDEDPKTQAAAAYDVYTGNNATYGCNAKWCSTVQIGCSEAITGIGQDDSCPPDDPEKESSCHRFCKGVWSGAATQVPIKLAALGGMEVVEAACKQAGKGIAAWSAVASARETELM